MDCIFKNNFGKLYQSKFILQINDKTRTIDIENLVRIQFVKRQKLHINYLALVLSIYLCYLLFTDTFSNTVQMVVSFVAFLLLIASYFFKSYQCRFVLVKKYCFTEMTVSRNFRKDAEELADQINKIIIK